MALLSKSLATFGLLFALASGSAFADTYRHIDDLAKDIESKARQIEREVRHYRHTPEYRHLVDDARQLRRSADHLHDVAHDHGSLAHMESDLREIDQLFHHLESVFDRVERNAAYGHGHIHGETSHVKRLLIAIEEDIHHLQDDLRALSCPVDRHSRVIVSRPPVVIAPPVNPWNSHGSHFGGYGAVPGNFHGPSRGFTIGGGSSRFTIRF